MGRCLTLVFTSLFPFSDGVCLCRNVNVFLPSSERVHVFISDVCVL